MSTTARGGYEYFITFTDDLSRYGYVYLMKHKSEAFEKFKEFQSEVQNQLGKKIKFLRSDRGGEYMSHEFDDHLKELWDSSSTHSAGNATEKWCVGKAEPHLVGHGTVNDKSDGSTFVILGLLSRNSSVHTKQSTIKVGREDTA